jgi:hypothetical protein
VVAFAMDEEGGRTVDVGRGLRLIHGI